MPYAQNGTISQGPIEGGIRISQEQYKSALSAMLDGLEVTIDGGFAIRHPRPSEHYVWENGEWVDRAPTPEPRPITAADVDAEHDRRAVAGKVFEVPGYGSLPLEGSLRTQTVLLALKDTARDLQEAGVTAPVLFFTDRDNGDHNLTADQVVDLVNAGKAFMQALHEAKRTLKAVEPIPADFASDSYWP
jgi:hypothetical protein